MNLQSRLAALRERHADLETRIDEENQRPRPDGEALGHLKREKLRIKEEIERIKDQEASVV